MTGRTIAHYQVQEKLGEGGMGAVYRALDTHLDRSVAIKVLRSDAVANPERKRRFVQEAKAASALNHPNIIHIYDIAAEAGVDYIAMEYVAGKTLDQVIGRKGLRLAETLKYAVQVADALAAAHAAGIVHRDLKPANLMVTDKGLVKVLDFGLAKLTEADASGEDGVTLSMHPAEAPRTEEGSIVGTVAYMSPEQAEGRKLDARSDIFSFGVVLYEMVTGQRAFHGETRMSTLAAVLHKEPAPLSQTLPAVPRDLERIIARCLRKDVERRFQTMADLKVALEELKEESESGILTVDRPAAPAARRPLAVLAGLAILALAATAGLTWWFTRSRRGSTARPTLTRLTSDSGITDWPAISPDGKFLAYASDRSGEPNLDIWVQQLPDGQPVRLTRDPSDDSYPAFSPDGSKIVFRSLRDNGGIYVIPTLGGQERLLAKRANLPRFSPDGQWISYSVGEGQATRMYVIPAGGGVPKQLAPDFYNGGVPIWSPDSKHLLFMGRRDPKAPPDTAWDWHVVPLEGGAAVATGFEAARRREKLGGGVPLAWAAQDNRILFHSHVGDTQNLWQIRLNPRNWQITGSFERVTFGTNDEEVGSLALDGRVAFTSRVITADLWTLLLDADQGKVLGEMKRLTQDAADDYDPSVTSDGKKVAFRSFRGGNWDVWVRDLETGKETVLTQSKEREYPVITEDGTRVAYSLYEETEKKTALYVVTATGGAPEKVCDDCGVPLRWSPDGAKIFYVIVGPPAHFGLLDVGSRQKQAWMKHPDLMLVRPSFSPDQRWLLFQAYRPGAPTAKLYVAPLRGAAAPEENEWIQVTDHGYDPLWSPNGSLVYFGSFRDGHNCLWAQRLDASTKRPQGDAFAVHHFHNRALSVRNLNLGSGRFSLARDKLVFNLGQHTGNIWLTRLPD